MKYTGLLIFGLLFTAFISCEEPNKKPGPEIVGTYTGSMNATWLDSNYIINSGFSVYVDEVDNNTVLVQGDLFDGFEVLVTWNGLNVEPVDASDEHLTEFVWIGAEEKLKFTYTKIAENESAYFIGVRN
jgi:hypothetical protein